MKRNNQYDLVFDEEFEMFLNACKTASGWPITTPELFKRWIASGLARDMGGDIGGAGQVVDKLIRIIPK